MGHARLASYVNDHLADAAAAIALLDRLAATDGEAGFRVRIRDLRTEIAEDRRILQTLVGRIGASPMAPPQAPAWLAERVARLKIGGGAGDTLARFESLEVLALGVVAKRCLWRTLDALEIPGLSSTHFSALAERADRQFERFESERVRLAPAAFAGLESRAADVAQSLAR
jgi:hypothetical protein